MAKAEAGALGDSAQGVLVVIEEHQGRCRIEVPPLLPEIRVAVISGLRNVLAAVQSRVDRDDPGIWICLFQ
jgi:hypothetical protein